MHHFIRPLETYTRDIRLIPTYVRDTATYISKQTGMPLEQCEEFVRREIAQGGQHALKIPDALVLVRGKNGDRKAVDMPFDEFLSSVSDSEEILSPSMAAYLPVKVKESFLGLFIGGNLKKRKIAKKQMFAADMNGDKLLYAIKNGEQNSLKLKNNSLSGGHSSPYTILWNKSSHSTLTSTCRTATSYGNANNEKFLFGNRHYWSPDIVKANIVSIINHSDYVAIENVMKRFKLVHPSVEQTMACISRSTDAYWRSSNNTTIIESLVKALKPIERSAFVYTGDFYHLAQMNPEFCRNFLTEISTKSQDTMSFDDALIWYGKMDDNLVAFVSMICAKELHGIQLVDLKKEPEAFCRVMCTTKNVIEFLDKYQEFISAFWITDNLPASVFALPSVIRRGAITSDTDSTIFTVQYWTEWYVGRLDFSEQSTAIASTMIYLAGQLIRHILARFSANMGVAARDLKLLSMKNEYYFPVFCLTSRAKHYFAYISAQEGNVRKKLELEVKGVALRNSNVPPFIMKKAHGLIRWIMDTVMRGEKISLRRVLRFVASIEHGITTDLKKGSYALLPKMQVKGENSYKNANSSNFIYYGMWQEVFATKYGHAPEPPYVAIKVSVDLDNPTKLREWLASLEDQAIAAKMQTWLTNNARKGLSQFLLPEPVLSMTGIPSEIIAAVDIRGLLSQTMESFYLILESLGHYMKNDNITRLVSDDAWLVAEDWPLPEIEVD